MLYRKIIIILGFSALIFVLPSCGVYSFTGASISPEVKTISVHYFPNNAPLVNSTLSQNFTEALKEKFVALLFELRSKSREVDEKLKIEMDDFDFLINLAGGGDDD